MTFKPNEFLLNFDNKDYEDAKKVCEESINFKF